ncbi:MAG: RecX family transcriptional regulator [Bacteroidales bacterium]|nr:RecX family transcriptional regulator [Bacteroidales bacterium]
MKTWTYSSALERMKKFCSLHEQCTYTVRLKLFQLQIPPQWHEQIIQELIKLQYLDDERYAQRYFEHRLSRHVAPKRIALELRSLHLKEEIIKHLLEKNQNVDEDEHLKEFLQKQLAQYHYLPNEKLTTRLFRSATRKGYDVEKIMEMISRLTSKENQSNEPQIHGDG